MIVEMDKLMWERMLQKNKNGNYLKSIDNFYLILENKFTDRIFLNDMTQKIELDGKNIDDVKMAELERQIEREYGIYDEKKFVSALKLLSEKHKYNPVKVLLEELKWDGKKRADTILCRYLGCAENEYTAICFRLFLFGAIERIYNPGAKFDYMLILKGGQGIGKSTFFELLAGTKNYQENLSDLNKAFEYTQGKWIVEIGELDGLKKAEVTAIKTYITLRNETIRLPYDRMSKDYPRKFVLLGTTNESTFLSDFTGSRRFIVLECAKDRSELKESIMDMQAKSEIRQALAEVFHEYKEGKKFLTLPNEYELINQANNKKYIIDDGFEGIVEGYLETVDECCALQIWDEAIEPFKKWKYGRIMANRIISVIEKQEDWYRYEKKKTILRNLVDSNGIPIKKRYEKQSVFMKKKEQEKDVFVENSNSILNEMFGTENENYFMKI